MAEPKTTNLQPKAGTRQARQRALKDQEADLETLVGELEARVDRLRAAYDQYFMGIEKLPPHVQIKDVERRLADLRKIQIRNTALRFKFQTTLQKYNTYQSYWQRIVRQIEEGTYKRDVRRANERFGTGAQRKGAVKEIEIDIEFEDMISEDADLAALLDAPFQEEPETEPETLRPAAPPAPLEVPSIPRSTREESRRLMSLDSPDAGMAYIPPRGPIEERPSQKHLPRGSVPPPAAAAAGRSPAKQQLPPGAFRPQRPPTAIPPAGQASPNANPPNPHTVPTPRRKSSAPPPKDGLPKTLPRKSSRPAQQQLAANGAAKGPAGPKPAPKPGDLSDERLRKLYSQYVETKRAQKESTAALSYDSLAKSLRESSERLKEKHGGKPVDFEVAVKDGKTILRPVVKEKA